MESQNVLDQFINKNSKRASEYMAKIEEMMGQHHLYGYAESTLIGIYDYINENNTITDKQCQAVDNIYDEPSPQHWRK